jgi:CubicO group peptidase (beta-lactamase class C family)
MSRRSPHLKTVVPCLLLVVAPLVLHGQQRAPSPGVRAVLDAFGQALASGNADDFEAMAKRHFAPALLEKQPAAERAARYRELVAEFGRITTGSVRREGPEAPLRMDVTGSKGVSGFITLTLEASAPFRITSMGVQVGGGSDPALPAPPIRGSMTAEELSVALDAYLAKLAADDRLSGTVLVARDGRPLFEKSYGLADRGHKVPNTPATRFSLGSINKAFTQVAIAQLASAGKLAYGDTLGKWIPDYPQERTRPATIEQLLSHSAGIADVFGDDFARQPKDRFRSNADYYRYVSEKAPLFAPGERRQYCNGCYITLGEIIARASGMPYERYVERQVFKAAGMTAGFPLADSIEPNIADTYTRTASDGQVRNAIYMRGAAGSAAGSAHATAADMLAFENALREGRLVDARGLARIFGDGAAPAPRVRGGYGIAGGAPGTNTIMESDGVWTVIVLTNFDPPAAQQIGQAIYRALAGRS